MSYLPPVGWADVATKQDLENLALRLEARIDRSISSQLRWIVGIMIAMTGVFGFIVSIVR